MQACKDENYTDPKATLSLANVYSKDINDFLSKQILNERNEAWIGGQKRSGTDNMQCDIGLSIQPTWSVLLTYAILKPSTSIHPPDHKLTRDILVKVQSV